MRLSHPAPRVAIVTLDHPPHNFGSWQLMEQVGGTLDKAAASDATVVVLASALTGDFMAHGDLDDIVASFHGGSPSGDGTAWHRVLRMLDRGRMVSIAAINGRAWGGGAELAWACNLRIAGGSASFGQPEALLGIIPGAGGTVRLVDHAGESVAIGICLCLEGSPLSARLAWELGLVHHLADDAGLHESAAAWAATIASRARAALQAVKKAIVEARGLPFRDAIRVEGRLYAETAASPEARGLMEEALARYAEGASPEEALGLEF